MQNHRQTWNIGSPCPTPHKLRFATKKDAKDYQKVKAKTLVNPTACDIYKCACGAFHLTSMPKWKATILNNIMYRPPLKNMQAFKKFLKK